MKKKNFNNENFNSFLKKFQNLLKKKFYVKKKEYFIVLKGRVDSICCSLYISTKDNNSTKFIIKNYFFGLSPSFRII